MPAVTSTPPNDCCRPRSPSIRQFAMAHRRMARVLQTSGERERSVQHLDRAFDLRTTVTARERYFIEAAYNGVHERYDDAVESLSLLVALYPDDLDAQYELATSQSAVGEIDRAIQSVREYSESNRTCRKRTNCWCCCLRGVAGSRKH